MTMGFPIITDGSKEQENEKEKVASYRSKFLLLLYDQIPNRD